MTTSFLVAHLLAVGTLTKTIFLISKLFKEVYQQKQFLFKSCMYDVEMTHSKILRKELCSNSKMLILLLKGYKIPYIASDETYTLEFMFFEKKGTELIGKSAETLRKKYDQKDIPPEISSWIGHKFTFVVKILPNKIIGADDPSFGVIRIREKLGKQPIMAVSKPGKSKPAISSSAYEEKEDNLPLLIPIASKKSDDQASSSQAQSSTNIQDMEIQLPYDDSDNSTKRNTHEIEVDNLEISKEDEDDKQHRKPKKPRLQEQAKH